CTNIPLELSLLNSGDGSTAGTEILVDLPTAGINIVAGSSQVVLPGGVTQAIADPIIIDSTAQARWLLPDLILAPSSESPLNEAKIRFEVQLDCAFDPASTFSYRTSWLDGCNNQQTTPNFFALPFRLNGAPEELNQFAISLDPDSLRLCSDTNWLDIQLIYQGRSTNPFISDQEFIRLAATDFTYVDNSIQNIQNMPNPSEPIFSEQNGQMVLEWPMPMVAVGDAIRFRIAIKDIPINRACQQIDLQIETGEAVVLPCDSTFCSIKFRGTSVAFSQPIAVPEFDFSIASVQSIPVNPQLNEINIQSITTNPANFIGSGLLTLSIYQDTNQDGMYTVGEDLFWDTLQYEVPPLASGESFGFTHLFEVAALESCTGYFMVLEAEENVCLCQSTIHYLPPTPLQNAGSDQAVCVGNSIELGTVPQPGVQLLWSPATYLDDPQSAMPTYQYTGPLTPGLNFSDTLVLTSLFPDGCMSQDSIVVTLSQPEASFILSQAPSCSGDSDGQLTVAINGGIPPFQYQWSDGGPNNPVRENLSAGSYFVSITDGQNCTIVLETSLLDPPVLESDLNTSLVNGFAIACAGDGGWIELITMGGTPPYQYLWSNDSTTQILTNVPAGTYQVTITDAQLCTTIQTTTLEAPDHLAAVLTIVPARCAGQNNGSIEVTMQGGVGPFSIDGHLFENNYFIAQLTAGIYPITVIDANNCVFQDTVIVEEESSSYQLTVVPPTGHNFGDGQACVSVLNGQGPHQYLWQDGTNTACHEQLTAGEYTVTMTDGNGCTTVQFGILDQPLAVDVEATGQAILCFGATTGAISLAINGGTPPYESIWSTGVQGNRIEQLSAGQYSVTVTDQNNCTWTESWTLTQAAPLTSTVQTFPLTCYLGNDAAIDLEIQGGVAPYQLLWEDGTSDFFREGLSSGTYNVSVTDANNCLFTEQITIPELPAFLPQIEVTEPTCDGSEDGQISIPNLSNENYEFGLDGLFYSSDPSIVDLDTGQYTVYVRDSLGCVFRFPTFIEQPFVIQVQAPADTTIDLGKRLQLIPWVNSLVYQQIDWQADDSSTNCSNCFEWEVLPLVNTTYVVRVIDRNGCVATDEVLVRVKSQLSDTAPNAFSPDDKGENNHFLPYPHPAIADIDRLEVFDRWGELLFRRSNFTLTDPSLGWDGTFRGQPMPPGVYVYWFRATLIDGSSQVFKGDVTLLR
ncbi:MAG: T9SS type B sorting domain-containing protein, partial [Bacteroidota bacterium]